MSISSKSIDNNSQSSRGAIGNDYIGTNVPFPPSKDDDGCRRPTIPQNTYAGSVVKRTITSPEIDNGSIYFTNTSTSVCGPTSNIPYDQKIRQINCDIPFADMAGSSSTANNSCNIEVNRSLSKSPSPSISISHTSQAIDNTNKNILTTTIFSTSTVASGTSRESKSNKAIAERNQAKSSSDKPNHDMKSKNSKFYSSKNKNKTENKSEDRGNSIVQGNNSIRTNTSQSISSSEMKRSFETMLQNIDYDLDNLRQPSMFFSCGSNINSVHTKEWSEKERKDLIALADRWLPSKKGGDEGKRKLLKLGEKEEIKDEKEA
mmetsp:Transcript_12342/g.26074  ORF Transcript_12342/g.26074 Transcript_12342/m.26074 type:complete len:318 (-) Transcript_12342:1500-2453(-)